MLNLKAKTNLQKVLESGEFAVTAEVGPPKGPNIDELLEHAEEYKDMVDAFNVTDNQTAIVRVSSLATCIKLQEVGVEPILQMTVRDRNRIGLQSDLLGANTHGITNVLCLSGDHQSFGDEPGAKGVFDLDSTQLIWTLKRMRDDNKFIGGEDLESECDFYIGAVANPFADPFEYRVDRLEKKIAAGVQYVQTQAIFDMDRFKKWMKEVRDRGLHKEVKIMAGVIPIKAVGAARYMQKHVSGITVPEEVIERFKSAEDKKKEGIKFCVEQIKEIQEIEGVAGVHMMPVAWEEAIPEIVEQADLLPRPKFD
ncbi:methylenetetrahydrofolate reductase [Natranaerofaba carboxydovora]|uniref:methylenetetrahydrofolate reductase n=1 Tax=Natranaerofaba carboxydovora TaxID=2742683 RepID=UPI003B847C7D